VRQKVPFLSDSREKNTVIDLERARAHLRSRGKASAEELYAELESIRELLDRGLTSDARNRLKALMARAGNQPAILAEARCVLSITSVGTIRSTVDWTRAIRAARSSMAA